MTPADFADLAVRGTAWLAMAGYFFGAFLILQTHGARPRFPATRWVWAIGWIFIFGTLSLRFILLTTGAMPPLCKVSTNAPSISQASLRPMVFGLTTHFWLRGSSMPPGFGVMKKVIYAAAAPLTGGCTGFYFSW